MSSVRIFDYVDVIDGFIVAEEYRYLAGYLGLTEWRRLEARSSF
jgi:hypothetical protein